MADTTKLASTFPAWRLTIGVRPEHLMQALARCRELGLQPNVCGHDSSLNHVLFRVFVPSTQNEDACQLSFEEVMTTFHEIYHSAKVNLIGPPAQPKQSKLLKRVAVVGVPGIKMFVLGMEILRKANARWEGPDFNVIEEDLPKVTLHGYRLEQTSWHASILAELGEMAESKLAHLFWLINHQSKGERGFLLTDGSPNIMYVRDNQPMLWSAHATFMPVYGFWGVGVGPIGSLYHLNASVQIISPVSLYPMPSEV